MNYSIYIDQKFTKDNELTITEALTLSAFISLTTWAHKADIGGEIWYEYTESKMCEDFPVLFGCEKRVYKNISALAAKGLVALSIFNKRKLVRFTEKCAYWGKEKPADYQSENGLQSPKTDLIQSENGPIPPTPPNKEYILLNNQQNILTNKTITPYNPPKGGSTPKPKREKGDKFYQLIDAYTPTIAENDWREIVDEFLRYKVEIGHPLKVTKSIDLFYRKLRKDANDNINTAKTFLEQAMAQGWQSYHPDAGKSFAQQKLEAQKAEKEAQAEKERLAYQKYSAEMEENTRRILAEYEADCAEMEQKKQAYIKAKAEQEAKEAAEKEAYERYRIENDLPF